MIESMRKNNGNRSSQKDSVSQLNGQELCAAFLQYEGYGGESICLRLFL